MSLDDHNHTEDSGENEPKLDPATALRTYADQRTRTISKMNRSSRISTLAWGLAWVVAYGALWLGADADGFPRPWAFVVFAAALITAATITTITNRGSQPQTSGRTDAAIKMFGPGTGVAWGVGMTSLTVVVMTYPMPPAANAVLYNLVCALLAGLQFVGMGAILGDRSVFVIGISMMIICLVGTVVGVPAGYLVMAILGGGGMLLWVLFESAWLRRAAPDGR